MFWSPNRHVRLQRKSNNKRGEFEKLEIRRLLAIDMSAPMESVSPVAGIFASEAVAGFSNEALSHDFNITLNANQQLSVKLEPERLLQSQITLLSPAGEPLGTSPVASDGETAVLAPTQITEEGVYTIRAKSVDQEIGAFTLTALTNASFEPESHGQSRNDSLDTATELTTTWHPTDETPISSVWGTRPSASGATSFQENFLTDALPDNWETFSSDPSGRIRVTDEFSTTGDYELWMDQLPSNVAGDLASDVDVAVKYDPATGGISIETAAPLGAFVIDSASGIFSYEAPENIGDSFFDLMRPNQMIKAGSIFGDTDFGIVTQPNLSLDFLRNDLSFNGTFEFGGIPKIELGEGPLQPYVLNEAVVELTVPPVVNPILQFSHTDVGDVGNMGSGRQESFEGHINRNGVSISQNGNIWFPIDSGGSLANVAERGSIDLSNPIQIKFQTYHHGSMPTAGRSFDNIEILGEASDDVDWYRFSMNDGAIISLYTSILPFDDSRFPQTNAVVSLYDSSGTLLHSITPASYLAPVHNSINGFRDLTSDGNPDTYFIEVGGEDFAYGLSVFSDGLFGSELTNLPNQTTILTSQFRDKYELDISLPGNGSAVTAETFVPSVRDASYDVDEDLVMRVHQPLEGWLTDTDSAPDGRNARLEFTTAGSGVHRFELIRDSSRPEPLGLRFTQSTPSINVVSEATAPVAGSRSSRDVDIVLIQLNERLRLDTLDTTKIFINGHNPSVSIDSDGKTLRLDAGVLSDGLHRIVIDTGAVRSMSGLTNEAIDFEFTIDQTPPFVAAATIQSGTTIAPGERLDSIQFSEPLDRDPSSGLTIQDSAGANVELTDISYDEVTQTLSYRWSPVEGSYTLVLNARSVRDFVGWRLDGERGTVPSGNGESGGNFIAPFTVDHDLSVAPTGDDNPFSFSQLTDVVSAHLADDADVDAFAVELSAGEKFAVSVRGIAGGLQPTLSVTSPSGDIIFDQTADFIQRVVTPVLVATTSGTYRAGVSTGSNIGGEFQLRLFRDGMFEPAEARTGVNDSMASATDLTDGFRELPITGSSFASFAGDFTREISGMESFENTQYSNWEFSADNLIGDFRFTAPVSPYDGNNSLIMNGNRPSEAVWRVPVPQNARWELSFAHLHSDATNQLPSTFEGSVAGDGVSVSVDGESWVRVFDPADQDRDTWQSFAVDLRPFVEEAGWAVGSELLVKFQYVSQWTHERRAFDAIQLTTYREDTDWFTFTLDDQVVTSVEAFSIDGVSKPNVELLDSAGQRITSGIVQADGVNRIHEFADTTTDGRPDRYYLRITGTDPYVATLTRGTHMRFDNAQPAPVSGSLGWTSRFDSKIIPESLHGFTKIETPAPIGGADHVWIDENIMAVADSDSRTLEIFEKSGREWQHQQSISSMSDVNSVAFDDDLMVVSTSLFGDHISVFQHASETNSWLQIGERYDTVARWPELAFYDGTIMFAGFNSRNVNRLEYDTTSNRWNAEPEFRPLVNVEKLLVLNGDLVVGGSEQTAVFRKTLDGDWVERQRLADHGLYGGTDRVLTTYDDRERVVKIYEYSTPEATWIEQFQGPGALRPDQAKSVVNDDFVLLGSLFDLLPLHRTNGTWIADEAFDFESEEHSKSAIFGTDNGTLAIVSQNGTAVATGRIQTWQRATTVRVEKGGRIEVESLIADTPDLTGGARLKVEIVDAADNVIATDEYLPGQPAQKLIAIAQSPGAYTVRASRVDGAFTYQLAIRGDVESTERFTATSTPVDGEIVDHVPAIELSFSHDVNQSNVSLDSIALGGVKPIRFDVINPRLLRFAFDPDLLPDGEDLQLHLLPGAIVSVEGLHVAALSSVIRIDSIGPTVLDASIADSDVVPPGDQRVALQFSETLDIVTISDDSIIVFGDRTGLKETADFVFNTATNQLSFSIVDLQEDNYTLSVVAGENGVRDLVGNFVNETREIRPYRDHAIRFDVDGTSAIFPTAERVDPIGSLITRSEYETWLHSPDDVDVAQFEVSAATPYAFRITKSDPNAVLMVAINNTEHLIDAAEQILPVTFASSVPVSVTLNSDRPTTVSVTVLQNAVFETGDAGVSSLSASMHPVGNGVRYGTVATTSPTTIDVDVLLSQIANDVLVRVDAETLVPFGEPIQLESPGFASWTDGRSIFASTNGSIIEYDLRGRVLRSIATAPFYESIAADDTYLYAFRYPAIDLFDRKSGKLIESIDLNGSPRAITMQDDLIYYLRDERMWSFDPIQRTETELFAVPFPIAIDQLTVTATDFYARRNNLVYQISKTGELKAALDYGGQRLLGSNQEIRPDIDRFAIPVEPQDEITIILASPRPISPHSIKIVNQAGDRREPDAAVFNELHAFAATVTPAADDTELHVEFESSHEFEYSIVASVNIEHSTSVVGETLGTTTGNETLDVIRQTDFVWIADGDAIIQYDVSTWQPMRRISPPIGLVRNDTLATNGHRLFIGAGEKVYEIDPLNPDVAHQVLTLSGNRVPEVADGKIVSIDQRSAIARELGRSFTVRSQSMGVYSYEVNQPRELIQRVSVPEFVTAPTAASYANGRLYVALRDGTVLTIEPTNGKVLDKVILPIESGLIGIAAYSSVAVPSVQRQPHDRPTIIFDRESYTPFSDVGITLSSRDLIGTGSVVVDIESTGGDRETIRLLESVPGIFQAVIPTKPLTPETSDGNLAAAANDILIVTYSEGGDDNFGLGIVPFASIAATTAPTLSFSLAAGEFGFVQIEPLSHLIDAESVDVLAELLNETTGVTEIKKLNHSEKSFLVHSAEDTSFSLFFDVTDHGIAETVHSVQIVAPDVDANGSVDIADLDLVCTATHGSPTDLLFDVNRDLIVDESDLAVLQQILAFPIGDSNGDGHFNSQDFVAIFQAAEYEDNIAKNSFWSTGDWNCDGDFSSSDFVLAFQSGQYSAAAIPTKRTHMDQASVAAAFADRFAVEETQAVTSHSRRRTIFVP